MWLFGRKSKTDKRPSSPSPEALAGLQLVRRTEITTEREWTSTVVRRVGSPPGQVVDGVVPEKVLDGLLVQDAKPAEGGEV